MKFKEKTEQASKRKQLSQPKCLGPIDDFEKHLPLEWWRSIFNSVYLKTDADVVENEKSTTYEVGLFLDITQASPNDHILDLCCGQGRHSIELSSKGYLSVSGIDRSRFLVRLARSRAQKLGLNIRFSEGDARSIKFADESIDKVMMMGNSFGYFEKENDDLKVLKEVCRILKGGGLLYLDITDGNWMKNNFEKRSWEWINQQLFVCRERHLATDLERLISREVVTHSDKGVIADQFYAERLYSFEDIKNQLLIAGFVSVDRHDNIAGESTRNQDLGMMQNRMVITALAPKKTTMKKEMKSRRKLSISVLLGDPRLPDSVKRKGKFNTDDFQTVVQLKSALNFIEQYEFSYIDDHNAVIRKYTQASPDFVFNLCDEGWKNNAFLELHVPALLEMLNIPYSGSGPDCLSICYNKANVCAIARQMDIDVPEEIWLDPVNQLVALPTQFPVILKPAYGDGSIGITQNAVVSDAEHLVFYFEKIKSLVPNVPILIQEFLEGREFSVGLIGNGVNLEVLPILEVDYTKLPPEYPKILGYESKWIPESPYWTHIKYVDAKLDTKYSRYLVDTSINLFNRLRCRDYARFDFRMNAQGRIKFLEVNPNPGWCWDGKLALMSSIAGISYPQMLEKILTSALERYKLKK